MNDIWSKSDIKSLIENFATGAGYKLTEVTKHLDHSILPKFHPELATWMDTINGHPGGWYHRAKHGHDFLANIGEVYDKFGAEGVLKYPLELLKDSTTPHGIPLPGTQFLVKSEVVGVKYATQWLSLNVADVFSGGLAFYSTYKLYKKKENGKFSDRDYIWASIGIGTKVVGGVLTHNPVLVLSGIADTAILITDFEEAKQAFKKFLNWELIVKVGSVGASAAIAGTSAAAGTMGVVTAIGTASTGTAISTLSGAAATNATLAAIGGGSLASGGLGIAGGMLILGTGGAVVGIAAGYGVYRYLKKKKAA